MDRITEGLVSWGASRFRRRCATAYMAGQELSDALAMGNALSESGLSTTVSFTTTHPSGERVVSECLTALDALAGESFSSRLSIKVSLLRFEPGFVRRIEEHARDVGVPLQFDSVAPETAERTFELAAQVAEVDVGIALPGRWRRSVADARLAVSRGYRVRVIKGQWPDPTEPSLDPTTGFVRVVDALAGANTCVSVATHDVSLASAALRRLLSAETPCELELLLGLPLAGPIVAARSMGVPVRVYVPYGDPWLPYSLRSVASQRWSLWWATQDALLGHRKPWRDLDRLRGHTLGAAPEPLPSAQSC
jgi:proline dehydrogenase